MKQTKLALLATVALASATLINVAGVKAAAVTPSTGIEGADGKTPTATTTAQFTVKAGKLTLDAAPDFNFGTDVEISTIMNSNSPLQQNGNKVEGDSDAHTTTPKIDAATDTLQVSDYRGAGSTW